MNPAALRTFLAIVESGSLVRASERLNVTQSTVTARLQTLERELGQTLLHRNRTPVELTSPGIRFKRYAQAMTDLWQQALQETSLPEGVSFRCNIGCHTNLWPTLGSALFNRLRHDQPAAALAAWPGEQEQLDQWLATGLADIALAYRPATQENQSVHKLKPETLILVSTRAGSPIRFDPGYVYVDAGDEFGRRHAAAYADAGTARVTFGCAPWALDYLLTNGGSAYLPRSLAAPLIDTGQLHQLADAPTFTRNVFLIINDRVATEWPWLPDVVLELTA